MMANPEATFFVAERDSAVVAVGAVGKDTITLNYVDPRHRRSGVSRALLAALEQVLFGQGVQHAYLESTATARAFYLSQGWEEAGLPDKSRALAGYPMRKTLSDRSLP